MGRQGGRVVAGLGFRVFDTRGRLACILQPLRPYIDPQDRNCMWYHSALAKLFV